MLRAVLAVSTSFAPPGATLPAAIEAMRDLGVRAVALHRAPAADETPRLARYAGRVKIVAVFADAPVKGVGQPVLVVEGDTADADRERSLEELCRRLHALKGWRVALRTPPDGAAHPTPDELRLVHEAVRHVGYWHDAARGGAEWLDAAGRLLRGASFHPLETHDLAGVRDALGAGAPAVVQCPPGTERAEVEEALRCARGVFRA